MKTWKDKCGRIEEYDIDAESGKELARRRVMRIHYDEKRGGMKGEPEFISCCSQMKNAVREKKVQRGDFASGLVVQLLKDGQSMALYHCPWCGAKVNTTVTMYFHSAITQVSSAVEINGSPEFLNAVQLDRKNGKAV